ncbi:baseplate J/gp47 family protein [Burkholderia cenocepacia]|uniref:baseplate J/gp47 family protein n=1 Tax=Burkholderia cenocepacia TaxID=95486 RepID=UPI002013AE20|nr:baseplate J/gp47 family protein [Burkholderia cenocepacia]
MSTPPTSSVPPINWASTGPVVPAESAILTGVLADTNAAFGGNLNITNEDGTPNVTTPQGQLASSLTAVIAAKNDDMLEVANGVDPDLADGRWQDAIGRIYFIERDPAEPTALQVACVGAVNTVIPVGALIKDSSNNVYLCTQAGTIPASGTITLGFACKTTGPVPVPAANQVSIYQAIPGWDTVTVVSGVQGRDVESRADFENRRRQSVAKTRSARCPRCAARYWEWLASSTRACSTIRSARRSRSEATRCCRTPCMSACTAARRKTSATRSGARRRRAATTTGTRR